MKPETREEVFLAKMAGENVEVPDPITRKELYYEQIIEAISSGGGGGYIKPVTGIPKSDLASDVQTSLGKADTALQSHQDITGKEDKTNKVTSLSSQSTDTQYPSAKCVYDLIGDIETLLGGI